ncbi:nicotinate phosphoribosyltransferase [Mycoplasma sp. U97]|uniref:nicotinate phosphoribosyltransferase n=1 Tax=Mycoplasma tauri TaxID=547987 RepID=UPI001967702F|nr:nicotinate phosphoribosyltransferase [Mycoplasma tauri]MBZ4212645.1 nicotinate phosphoribosyltransferase [Mycoplasma tauri]QSB07383.1 nicotinate phosphoribosyltransferase [Mycoplasma tauri]
MSKDIIKYTATYFEKTKQVIKKHRPDNVITLQFFQRKDNSLLAGMQEVLDFLEKHTDTSKYEIRYLEDGTIIQNREVVLELIGKYEFFGIYEGIIDGILTRSTSIATNARECVLAANGKNIIFMGDRADHYLMQEIDGKAVALAGITSMSTDAQNVGNEESPFGSVPHIFIQNFDGNTGEAMKAYADVHKDEKIISLVDYHNDVIAQSLESFEALGSKLYGVRIDTSKNMLDHMFDRDEDKPENYGVSIQQVKRLRKALDEAGAKDVKIIVSSGFNPEKIKKFEEANTPVDSYGVGQSIFKFGCFFSADATVLNGKPQAKEGRGYRENPRLIQYKNKKN